VMFVPAKCIPVPARSTTDSTYGFHTATNPVAWGYAKTVARDKRPNPESRV
jgi:hypothetical protein